MRPDAARADRADRQAENPLVAALRKALESERDPRLRAWVKALLTGADQSPPNAETAAGPGHNDQLGESS